MVSASLGTRTSAAKALPVNFLAIPAMAHRRARRVGLRRVAHRAAQVAAFDLHLDPFLSYPLGSGPNECCYTWCPPYGQDQLVVSRPKADQTRD
jgi:hypothetical protein